MKNMIVTSSFSLFVTSVISAIILIIVSNTGYKKSIKVLCSLLILLQVISVLSPLFSLFSGLRFEPPPASPDISTNESTDIQINEAGKQICRYTKDMLSEKFSLAKEDFTVSATLDYDGEFVKIKNITVEFLTTPDIDYNLIASFITDFMMCECIILLPDA